MALGAAPPIAAAGGRPAPTAAATPLHYEVADFARRCAPSLATLDALEAAVKLVDTAARKAYPNTTAVPFGSQLTGLALPWSDLDIVVLGVEG